MQLKHLLLIFGFTMALANAAPEAYGYKRDAAPEAYGYKRDAAPEAYGYKRDAVPEAYGYKRDADIVESSLG
ncbi:unnamed protein product [Rhizophagus irregularis]|nr:unnamed protein product [Rhizophagus irregularis]